MGLPTLPAMAIGTLLSRTKVSNSSPAQKLLDFLSANKYVNPDEFNYSDGAVVRAEIIEMRLRDILEKRPDTSVLSLGSGLSTYFQTLDTGVCHWIDVDLPDIIKIREQVFPSNDRCRNVACDMKDLVLKDGLYTAEDGKWAVAPDLVLAEGLLMYLPKEKAKTLITSGHMIFDVLGAKRTVPRSPEQLWTYSFNEWDLKMKQKWQFDGDERDSWLFETGADSV